MRHASVGSSAQRTRSTSRRLALHGIFLLVCLSFLLIGAGVSLYRVDSRRVTGARPVKKIVSKKPAQERRSSWQRSMSKSADREDGEPVQGLSEGGQGGEPIEWDPPRALLKEVLADFTAAKTYRFSSRTKISDGNETLLDLNVDGRIRDHTVCAARMEKNGETVEILSKGPRSVLRGADGAWVEVGNGWGEGELPPMAAELAREWTDAALAALPIAEGGTEVIGGVPCRVLRCTWDGALADDENAPYGGAAEIAFLVDANEPRLRQWRMTNAVGRSGRTVHLDTAIDYSDFNVPWTEPVPEIARALLKIEE